MYRKMLNYIFEDEEGKQNMKLIQTLGEHEFMIVNTDYSEYYIGKSYPPLSQHITKYE
jgi:hypothetical protein